MKHMLTECFSAILFSSNTKKSRPLIEDGEFEPYFLKDISNE